MKTLCKHGGLILKVLYVESGGRVSDLYIIFRDDRAEKVIIGDRPAAFRELFDLARNGKEGKSHG